MDLDPTSHLGAMAREVRRVDRAGRMARVVVARRTYATSIDDLWDALTDGERIPRWFMPVHGDLRLGGRYRLEGNAEGEIIACDPPQHLAVTWEYDGDVSWVDVRLSAASDDSTELVLEHTMHVEPDRWDEYGPGAVGVGWDQALFGLGLHVDSGETSTPLGRWPAWPVADGKVFIRACSDDWQRASVADGTDPAAAEAAAERTRAAYTGELEPPADPDGADAADG